MSSFICLTDVLYVQCHVFYIIILLHFFHVLHVGCVWFVSAAELHKKVELKRFIAQLKKELLSVDEASSEEGNISIQLYMYITLT